MKKTIITSALIALGFGAAAVQADTFIGVNLYDFGDSDVRIHGATDINDRFSVRGEFIDAGDYVLRATVAYALDYNVKLYAGASRYDTGWGSENGGIVGGEYNFSFEDINFVFNAQYDTAGDGFFTAGALAHYALNEKFAVEFGYRYNTDHVDNELGFGIRYTF